MFENVKSVASNEARQQRETRQQDGVKSEDILSKSETFKNSDSCTNNNLNNINNNNIRSNNNRKNSSNNTNGQSLLNSVQRMAWKKKKIANLKISVMLVLEAKLVLIKMVEPSTHDPKFEGSSPALADTWRKLQKDELFDCLKI